MERKAKTNIDGGRLEDATDGLLLGATQPQPTEHQADHMHHLQVWGMMPGGGMGAIFGRASMRHKRVDSSKNTELR